MSDEQSRSDEYEQAYLEFLKEGQKYHGKWDDWDEFKRLNTEAASDLMEKAERLLALAADEGHTVKGEAAEAVAKYTAMNQNDARAQMKTAKSEAAIDEVTLRSVTKLRSHDPERDPVFLMDVDTPEGGGIIRTTTSEFTSVREFAHRLIDEFAYMGLLRASTDDWMDFIVDRVSALEVEVRTEDPTRPEHVVAESVVSRLSSCDVTVNAEEFRTNTGTTIYYDESDEQAFVAADLVDTARGRINESASGDAVVSVLQERGLVPDEDNVVRPWGEGYFRVWEFTPSALIEQGVVEARLFEDPSDGRGDGVVA